MRERFSILQPIVSQKTIKLFAVTFATVASMSTWINPSFAADPFRTNQPHKIGDRTEAAFNAIFQQGNYTTAERYLQQALSSEPNEPLVYAMQASLAFANKDLSGLETYSKKTLEVANNLVATDPLRGNLYIAVGHFLGGAAILSRQGTTNGAAQAFSELQEVYDYLDKAEAISPNDPEVNLLKGYMDLILALNVPFANPSQAIERFEKNAAPKYLVDRGIAIAYRDLKQYPQALDYTNRALAATPQNPELFYLKAQILRSQARGENNQQLLQEAVADFDKALVKKSQLPTLLVNQIQRERRNAASNLANVGK